MSTSSYIAYENPDKSYDAIYCHWDGMPSHQAPILIKYYNTADKVKELIALGNLSSLEKEIAPPTGVKHTFDEPYENVTVAYHRDRGDELSIMHIENETKLIDTCAYGTYLYVFKPDEQQWYTEHDKTLIKLHNPDKTKHINMLK